MPTPELPVIPSLDPPGPQPAEGCGLSLRWQPTMGAANKTGYIVFRRTASGGAWRQVSGIVAGNSFDDATALRGISYRYQVQSIDARGRLSKPSATQTRSY